MKLLKLYLFLIVLFVFWILIIWNTKVLQATFVERDTFFSNTFHWWSTTKISDHYFLGIINKDYILNNQTYTSYTVQALLLNYGVLSLFNLISGKSYEVTQNFLVYPLQFLFLLMVVATRYNQIKQLLATKNILHLIWIFLILGILLTNPLPWISFLKYSTENFYFLLVLIFCYISVTAKTFTEQKRDLLFLVSGVVIGSFFIVFLVPWIFCYIYCESRINLRKKMLVNISIVCFYGIISYLFPFLLQELNGFKNVSSGFLFRSGLDGSSNYLKSTFSPILSAASEQHFGNILLLSFGLISTTYILKSNWKYTLDRLIMSLIPGIFIFVLIPQHCTIHMYMFEFLIITPLVFNLIYQLLSIEISQLSPKKYVFFVGLFLLLIMGQLVEISKSFLNW